MLATYAQHLLNCQREICLNQDASPILNEIVLSGHAKTLASVRSSLGSSDEKGGGVEKSETLVAAIVSLACYAHLCMDMDVWRLHMAAIARIFEAIGFALSPRLMALVEW